MNELLAAERLRQSAAPRTAIGKFTLSGTHGGELNDGALKLLRTLVRDQLQGGNDNNNGSDVGLYRIEDTSLGDATYVFGLFDRAYGYENRESRLMGNVTIQIDRAASHLHISNVYINVRYRGERWCSVMLTEAIRSVLTGEQEKPHEAGVDIDTYYPMAATICYFTALTANGYEFAATTHRETPVDTLDEYESTDQEDPWIESLEFVAVEPATNVREGMPLPTFEEYDRLVDRISSQLWGVAGSTVTKKRKSIKDDKSSGYGEVKPRFMKWFIDQLEIDADDVFVDIGSGTGNVVAYMAAVTGAKAIGVDNEPDLHNAAQDNIRVITEELHNEHMDIGSIHLIVGDARKTLDTWPRSSIGWGATVVFINNFLFPDTLTRGIIESLIKDRHMVGGTRLFLMKPLKWGYNDDDDEEIMRHMDFSENRSPRIMKTPLNVVSWTATALYPVLYVISNYRSPDQLFRDHHRREYLRLLRRRGSNTGEW
jgi:SAM-dependent methyltransferase